MFNVLYRSTTFTLGYIFGAIRFGIPNFWRGYIKNLKSNLK